MVRGLGQQASFFLHAFIKGGARHGVQGIQQRPGNGGALNEFNLAIKDVVRVGVEADDESTRHPQPLFVDQVDATHRVDRQVLEFLVSCKASLEGLSIPRKT